MRIRLAPWAKSSASGSAKVKYSGATGDLGEAAERAEGGDAVAGLDRRAVGGAAHDAGDLAAGHERQRRFDLVLPARLQHLREGHAGGVDVDDARPRRG